MHPRRTIPTGALLGLALALTTLLPTLATAQTRLVSKSASPVTSEGTGGAGSGLGYGFFSYFGGAAPTWSQVSADGHYVVFESTAPNLAGALATDVNNASDVFIWDTLLWDARLISVAGSTGHSGHGPSMSPALSADGRYVAFVSYATDLIPGLPESGGQGQVYVYDRVSTPHLHLVSHQAGSPLLRSNGSAAGRPVVSADGRYVAFLSKSTDLVAGGSDGNGVDDLFLYDRVSDATTLVSHRAAAANDASNGRAFVPALSADGRFVAYESLATDLVAGQVGGGLTNVFLFDRLSGANALVSHKLGFPATAGNEEAGAPSISADGAFVTFSSYAWNLVAGTTPNYYLKVFLYDRAAGTNLLVSQAAGAPGTPANDHSGGSAISADGGVVAFTSLATDLVPGQVDTPGTNDVFVYQRASGTLTLASHLPGVPGSAAPGPGSLFGGPLALSDTGRFVLYGSKSTGLTATVDTNDDVDLFLFDGATGQNQLASGIAGGAGTTGNRGVPRASLSADGAVVAFESRATDLMPGFQDVNGAGDVFVFDRAGSSLVLASRQEQRSSSAGGDSRSGRASTVSADGRYAVFASDAPNLVAGQADANDDTDVFLADLHTGQVTLVSHALGALTTTANAGSSQPVLSADGAYVLFLSRGQNLVAGQVGPGPYPASALFLWERATGALSLVSHAAGSATTAASGSIDDWPVLSADGRHVAYASSGTDLVPGQADGNGALDVFFFDRLSGATTLVSHASGSVGSAGDGLATSPALSADGRYLVFESAATNLVPGQVDSNGQLRDTFLYDRTTGATTLLSHAAGAASTCANGASYGAQISSDGSRIAFESEAGNLMAGITDPNGSQADLYLVDRSTGAVALVSHAAGSLTTTASGLSELPALSADGQWLAFQSLAPNIVPGQIGNSEEAAFLYETASGTNRLVSHSNVSASEALDGTGSLPGLSADGRFVVFSSFYPNVAPGQIDHNGEIGYDVFLYDRASGANRLLSHVPASVNDTGNANALGAALSADGGTVLFQGPVSDLVADDWNARYDVFATWNELVPPTNPTSLTSTSHTVSSWSRVEFVDMQWSGAADSGSGLAGYSVAFDFSPSTTPDATIDVPHTADPHHFSSVPLPDGTDRYFHLRTCDQAGNCSAAIHAGPYWIDSHAPTVVTGLNSSSHTVGVPSSDTTIDVAWTAASDATSGVDGYEVRFDASADPHCALVKTVEESVTSFTSPTQPDGNRWVHICTVDNAGNWSGAASAGPFRIATGADLEVGQTASPEPLSALGTLTYTLTVANHGGLDASGVTLTDTLPSGAHFVSSLPGEPACAHAGGVLTCSLGSLAFEASFSVTLTVAVDAGFTGTLDNHVTATAVEPDGNPANNTNSRLTRVVLQKGDLDNDTWPEILFRNAVSGRYTAWLMNGTTRLSGRFVTPDPASTDWLLSAVDDIDGDQRNDLVFWNRASGLVEFWLMNGTQRVGDPLPLAGASPLVTTWVLQASADFDHDGHPDLLWRNTASQQLAIWTLNGATKVGTLVPNPDHAADANWQVVAALDLDDDGNVDLLWYNTSSGKLVEWLLDASLQRTLGRFTVPPNAGAANWKVVAAADFGVDASPLALWNDVLWRNADTGKLVVWHLNAQGQRLLGTFTTPDAPADALGWTVVGPR